MWAEFLGYLDGLSNDLTIYHYHHFESTHLRKLAERYGISEEQEEKLFGHLVDLHSTTTRLVLYGLSFRRAR